ncbi:hypothetical protein QBC47DRAFT_384853 [Echria macrotheca]|uniref:DnaJ homologue subfamily C member 28 conserved domain-containing protein n=1 Tax=Echria macrotheca TaxID=438768 RepID=A0AAJ0F8W0_9PEZI|nr:hypothetical protein QBC47DRAFT_384853 [Echria macrotheca]
MSSTPYLCAACTRALRRPPRSRLTSPSTRQLSHSSRRRSLPPSNNNNNHAAPATPEPPSSEPETSEKGAMTRRLEEATESALLEGTRASRRTILSEAGFSEDLRDKLLAKLADAQFSTEHASALSQAGLGATKIPAAAGEGTRHVAAAQPWTGEEATEDAVLRMLNDARKPLGPGQRGKVRAPEVVVPVDLRIRGSGGSRDRGVRVASARDRAQAYAGMGLKEEKGLSQEEREALRKEFRERFRPGARGMPSSVTGLAALANERIEDAIARGQFKNIPRGPGVERDARADNPFIDTTEYIMNKMIKRQEIVPPWIEKQQELLKAATVFRKRLRNDWRRHAARMIASRGGTLQEQMDRATAYARAEEAYNPRRTPVEQISVPTNSTDDVVMARIRQQTTPSDESPAAAAKEEQAVVVSTRPFRDPDWEAAEKSYMELAIANLNAITRSYNLMAPELAKKPYFSLQRELDSCYAEVAPELAREIEVRATAPPVKTAQGMGMGRTKGILELLGGGGDGDGGGRARERVVYDSPAPHYGLKEFWRDLWGK